MQEFRLVVSKTVRKDVSILVDLERQNISVKIAGKVSSLSDPLDRMSSEILHFARATGILVQTRNTLDDSAATDEVLRLFEYESINLPLANGWYLHLYRQQILPANANLVDGRTHEVGVIVRNFDLMLEGIALAGRLALGETQCSPTIRRYGEIGSALAETQGK